MHIETLSPAEAMRLLATVPVGRVVFTLRALPAIHPVNFILDRGAVVFRTGSGEKLAAAVRGAVVAFAVDEIDPVARSGWNVTVTGQAAEIEDPDEIARLEPLLRSWADGERGHFILIRPELVSGRRLGPAAEPEPAGRAAG